MQPLATGGASMGAKELESFCRPEKLIGGPPVGLLDGIFASSIAQEA